MRQGLQMNLQTGSKAMPSTGKEMFVVSGGGTLSLSGLRDRGRHAMCLES